MMSDPEQIEKLQEQAAKLREEVAAMEAEVRANRKPEPESASNIAPSPAPVTPAPVPNKDEGWLNGLGALFDRDDEQIGEVPAPAPRPMLNNDDEISAGDRALASAAFLLPYFDGITFGTYIFKRFPIVAALLVGPVAPLYAGFNSLPFGGFLVFLALSFGSRQPDKLSRFVRFSFQQAILIDIALIFPQLFGSALQPFIAKVDPGIIEPTSNFVFYAVLISVVYSVGSNAVGKMPDGIPVISDAAKTSIGPF